MLIRVFQVVQTTGRFNPASFKGPFQTEDVMANAVIAGNVFTVDNPDAEGSDSTPYEHKIALVIEFESVDEIREAMEKGEVKFTVFA